MHALRDLTITVVILMALLGGLLALPVVFLLGIVIGIGYLVYAAVHDHRIEKQQRERIIQRDEFPDL